VRAAAVHLVGMHPYPGFRQDLVALLDDNKEAVLTRGRGLHPTAAANEGAADEARRHNSLTVYDSHATIQRIHPPSLEPQFFQSVFNC
jgi:hypothetical protein